MKGKTCCVTGHRDLPQNEINKIKTALAHEIDAAVTDGFTCFMSGFADGVDQYFVELVLERKQTTPALELIAVIPYRKRLDSLNKKTRTRELLEACADVVVIQEKYLPSVYSHRNRYMVEHSDRVIAVYDGRETGGMDKGVFLVKPNIGGLFLLRKPCSHKLSFLRPCYAIGAFFGCFSRLLTWGK